MIQKLQIQFDIDPELYSKNPDSSKLGRKIISNSISMINEMGFEDFTFKKLGLAINSPESSIYRYFVNKHMLLIYLTSWYWTWTEYRLAFATTNVASPLDRLDSAIDLLTQPVLIDDDISYVNEIMLSKIIFSESIKAYHTKDVDEENKKGCFKAYKSVVNRVGAIVLEINPDFKYPHMLISTVIEGAHQQKYFSEHLPELTDLTNEQNAITKFYKELVFSYLK
ncbi:TetR/AcrR family transcriptional regulator [Flavicella sediminum]|uniref:TetR/AcrR family transcriptional regulator n=1 Tax=Flavicella sediminum TaxID=2585141 RepID=UPI001407F7E2|nr:TetR/AcrR family transcriptional regulator [Flavicella sediminum]